MTKTAHALLKAAEAAGYAFHVDGGGDTADYEGPSAAKAWEAVNDVEHARVGLVKPGHKTEVAVIIPDLDPSETLADYTCGGFIEKWAS